MDEPIQMLGNRYQLLQHLGSGGFGNTFLAKDTQMPSNRPCVIKQLKPIEHDPQANQLVRERFEREAMILEQLGATHRQIPELYAYFSEGDHFYLVQELVIGQTLTEMVRQQGVLSEATVWQILAHLLPVLAFIHQKQVIHRDIKPENIILREQDGQPVLIDFGAVKEGLKTVIQPHSKPQQSIVVGTPGFMPSEQLEGHPTYASDLYGLGYTAIYLLTGKSPQEFSIHPQTGQVAWEMYAPNVRSGMINVLNRAIAPPLQARFSSAQEMLQALQAIETIVFSPIAASMQGNVPSISANPLDARSGGKLVPPTLPAFPSQPNGSTSPQAVYATPSYGAPQPFLQEQPSRSMSDWKKAILIGSIMAIVVLLGLVIWSLLMPKEKQPVTTPTSRPSTSISPEPESSDERPTVSSNSPEAAIEENTSPVNQEPSDPIVNPVEEQRVEAVINDPDGYTNIRSAPGTQNSVVAVIYEDEIFYTMPQENAEWWPAWTQSGEFGYMYYNRIQLRN